MKKYLLLIVLSFIVSFTYAQLVNNDNTAQKKQRDLDWFNCSFEQDSVYGAEVNRAYEFLKGKKVKKRPIVALIGSGIDVEHEDLKESIWVNKKEKNNGKDNDKNGLVGDLNGWNFLGGKDGSVMEVTLREGEREFLLLKDKYADYIFDGKDFFKVIDGKKTKVDAPANMEEYNYYRNEVLPESRLAGSYAGYQFSYLIQAYANHFNQMMKEKFPNQELTQKEFGICYDPKAPRDSLSEVVFMYMAMYFTVAETDRWENIYAPIRDGVQLKSAKAEYEKMLAQYATDNRKEIIGDDYLNIDDNKYGNNILLTSDAAVATLQAGVIAAKRDGKQGMNGIVDQAQIMTLRVQGLEGEAYLKDMALAIRYAVDHKADVVVLPEQNSLYPPMQRVWIEEALRYAESKGVLVIVPSWELSLDLSKETLYPNRWMAGEKELTNLMVVSSSDKNGNPAMESNYGKNEIDLYAPGIDIYSTYTGDTYQMSKGPGLAAATTAGVAALIKAYYPHLTGSQIRDLLIKNVTSRADVEVEKGIRVNEQMTQDLFLFGDLCLAGGILNAYQAIVAAEKLSK